jgi:hypothetical protein
MMAAREEIVSPGIRFSILLCLWLLLIVVAAVIMPNDGPTPRMAVAMFSVAIAWTVLLNSIFAGRRPRSDTAFEIGRQFVLVPYAAIATALAVGAATAIPDGALIVLQALNAAIFCALFVFGRGATSAVAGTNERRRVARIGAAAPRDEAAGLVADVGTWGVENAGTLTELARAIAEDVQMMAVRAGKDTSASDADLLQLLHATRRRLSAASRQSHSWYATELSACAVGVRGLIDTRERTLKGR